MTAMAGAAACCIVSLAAQAQSSTPPAPDPVESASPAASVASSPAVDLRRVDVRGRRLRIGEEPDAEGKKNYIVTRQSTGSKSDAEIRDVPQDIIIIPSKVIVDQNLTSVSDALRNVAGFAQTGSPPYTLQGNYEVIRGFSVSEYLRNGLFDNTNEANHPYVGNAERIEVLKGSAALLYGATVGSIGGIINTVTKKPLLTPTYTIGTTFDTDGLYGVNVDLSQPLTADKTWAVRLISDAFDTPTFVDHNHQRAGALTLVVQGQLDRDTVVTGTYEHLASHTQYDFGIPAYGVQGAHFGRRDNPSATPDSQSSTRGDRFEVALDHQFNADWIWHTVAEWTRSANDGTAFVLGWNADGTGTFFYSHNDFIRKAVAFDTTLNGHFDILGHANDVVIGATYTNVPTNSDYIENLGPLINGNVPSPSAIPRPAIGPASAITKDGDNWYRSNFGSIYLNDVVDLTDALKVSAGVSEVRSNSRDNEFVRMTTTDHAQHGTATRIGPIYRITSALSAFADYATTYVPQNSPQFLNGQPVYTSKPLEGEQWEAGVKMNVVDRVDLTAAVYQLKEKNVFVNNPDPVLAAQGFRTQIGAARSRGVELDAAYHPLAGLDFIGSYAYTQAETTQDTNAANVGHQFGNIPHNAASLWGTYELQGGALKGLGFGGGAYAVGRRPTNTASAIDLPGYVNVNAVVYYNLAGWRASVNVTNLFDTHYQVSASGSSYVFPGQPIAATFRLSKTF